MAFVLAVNVRLGIPSSGTLIVPDEYATIQSAVNAANPGDLVYVKSGTYNENIGVNTTLLLVGEDPQDTVINGSVTVISANMTLTGFRMFGDISIGIDEDFYKSGNGYNFGAGPCNIFGNNITGGVGIYFSSDCNVYDNSLQYGIDMREANQNNITSNIMGGVNTVYSDGNNYYSNIMSSGVQTYQGSYTNIVGNTLNGTLEMDGGGYINIAGNTMDALIFYGYASNITGNNITSSSSVGIELGFGSTDQDRVVGNIIANHVTSIDWDSGCIGNDTFLNNNFINNTQQLAISGSSPHASVVAWDNSSEGNYWSDYTTKYPNAVNNGGIWNTPYIIEANNTDHYPLVDPVFIQITQPKPIQLTAPTPPDPPAQAQIPEYQTIPLLLFILTCSIGITYKVKHQRLETTPI
jgi:hypothetical protein